MQPNIPKFSQSVGPGVRPPSPVSKLKGRQSLPRPESPLRKVPVLAPTPGRGPSYGPASFSRSQIGTPRFTPSPGPKPPAKTPQPTKMYSRASSRTGTRMSTEAGADVTPIAIPPPRSSDGSGVTANSSASGFTPVTRRSVDDARDEINRLRKQLDDRDRQLKEQAGSLAEMESSLIELQSLMSGSDGFGRNGNGLDDVDVTQLRAIVREKNEKISMLTAEFDAHRADLRSTLDALELAGSETERVYEKRVEELLTEIRELSERNDDVEQVAKQLKQLEEVVQDLEESVEDARRGEAEARGEAEFLRGEVERTKAELKREKDKARLAVESAEKSVRGGLGDTRDLEQRDDEIRGLKAIIHSLSSGPDLSNNSTRNSVNNRAVPVSEDAARMQASIDRLEREKKELQALVERKAVREDELEQELESVRLPRSSVISNTFSDRTAIQEKRSSGRDSKGTVLNWRDRPDSHNLNGSRLSRGESKAPMATMPEATDSASSTTGSAVLWCEICESGGHDILSCPNIDTPKVTNGKEISAQSNFNVFTSPTANKVSMATNGFDKATHLKNVSISSQDPDKPRPLMMNNNSSFTKLPPSPTPGAPLPSLPPPPGAAPTGPLPRPGAIGPISSYASNSTQATVKADISRSSMDQALVPGKDGTRNASKWCAICEHDGHDSINCALEDQF
jgi:CLIP1 zinc knuckle